MNTLRGILAAAATVVVASLLVAHDFPGPESGEYAGYAVSVLEDGDLNIANQYPGEGTMLVSSTYNKPDFHAHGGVVVWVPALILQRAVQFLTGLPGPLSPAMLGKHFYLALTTLACAMIILLLTFQLAVRLSSRRDALVATALVALGSPFAYYTLLEPGQNNSVATLFATLLIYYLWTADPRRLVTWIVTGLFAGMCVIVKVDLWFLLLFAAGVSAVSFVTHRPPPERVLLGILGFALMIGAKIANDVLRLGVFRVIEIGVLNVRGFFLIDELFSPFRGYFYYSPVLLIALVMGAWGLIARLRSEDHHGPVAEPGLVTNFAIGTRALPIALLGLLGVVVLKILVISFRYNWHGGTFGGRLLLTETTPIILLFAYGLHRAPGKTRQRIIALAVIAGLWNWVKVIDFMRREEAVTFPTLWGGLASFANLFRLPGQWDLARGPLPVIDRLLLAIPAVSVGVVATLIGGRLIRTRDRVPVAIALACAVYLGITLVNVMNNPTRAREIAKWAETPGRIAVIPPSDQLLDENLGSLDEVREYYTRTADRRACEIHRLRSAMWAKASDVFRQHRPQPDPGQAWRELCGEPKVTLEPGHGQTDIFQSYFDHRTGAEPLVVLGDAGSWPSVDRRLFERLTNPSRLHDILARPERVLAIVPDNELCRLPDAAARRGFRYQVVDADNQGRVLLTNRAVGKERDLNPLRPYIRREEPVAIQRRLSATTFEDKIELVGYDMPASSKRGHPVPITLYFKVLRNIPRNYRVFVHLEADKIALHADHDAIEGRCPTSEWRPGDYIIDTFSVPAISFNGDYSVWVGVYAGTPGTRTNLKVAGGTHDGEDRVRIGSVQIRTESYDSSTDPDHDLYQSYLRYRAGAEPLGILEGSPSGPRRTADTRIELLAGRPGLLNFLARRQPVLAIAPADDLCAVRRAALNGGFTYQVVDRNPRWLLLGNRSSGRDANPLLRDIRGREPEGIQHRVSANFGGGIELIGYDMPPSVPRGDAFRMNLYFKVVGKPAPDHQIFVHFDAASTQFQANHHPLSGTCDTTWWDPGDYLIDRFEVKPGDESTPGQYEVWVGFYTGARGKWNNLKVVSGPHDGGNRMRLGTLQVF